MNFHQKALLIGAITFLLCIGVVLWTFVLDKGTLTISGDPSYSVEISGPRLKVSEKKDCLSNPCLVRLPSGSYEVSLSKSGYYPEELTATIKRQGSTAISVDFEYVPTLDLSGNYEDLLELFEPHEVNSDFTFEMDETYKKQRLTYTDPNTGDALIWAYFDRELEDPVAFASPSLKFALVLDQGAEDQSLYLIDGTEFSRSYLGSLAGVANIEWSLDDAWALVRTIGDEGGLWIVETETAEFKEWPFEFSLEKTVWGNEDELFFATDQNLAALEEGSETTNTIDVLKTLLNGDFNDSVAFSIGVFEAGEGDYRALYEVPTNLELNYEDVTLAYDKETDQLYFSDGIVVFEVKRHLATL